MGTYFSHQISKIPIELSFQRISDGVREVPCSDRRHVQLAAAAAAPTRVPELAENAEVEVIRRHPPAEACERVLTELEKCVQT